MTPDEHFTEQWLRRQLGAVCANLSRYAGLLDGEAPLLRHVAEHVYPRLCSCGRELPLNLVLDLSCVFSEGPDIEFRPSDGWPLEPKEAQRYCSFLRRITAKGPFRNMVVAARRTARQRRLEMKSVRNRPGTVQCAYDRLRPGKKGQAFGLFTFLDLIAFHLAPFHKGVAVPPQVRQTIENGRIPWPDETGGFLREKPHAGTGTLSGDIAPAGLEDDGEGFCRSFENPANAIFAVASSGVPDGASGLDLGLLKHCIEYAPLALSREQSLRKDRLEKNLQGGPIQSSRSPETGNRGIATKGGPTSILRSHLARDNFTERAMLKQLLYYDRRTPRFRPRRMTAAWIIDLGRRMRTRGSTGSRRDTIARMVVARLVEDCVRYFGNFSRLHTTIAVALHHREKDRLHCRIVVPPDEIVRRATALSAVETATTSPWLPMIDGILPYFFLREPIFRPGGDCGSGFLFSAKADPETPSHLQAFQVLEKSLCSRAMENGFQDDSVCDLLHAVFVGPEETLAKDREKSAGRFPAKGGPFGTTIATYLNVDREFARWRGAETVRRASDRNFAEETHEQVVRDDCGDIRRASWNLTADLLSAL